MKNRARVVLIRAAEKSGWHSQNQVHRQLEKAYRASFPGACSVVEFSERGPLRLPALDENDRLVLLDHHLQFPRLRDVLAPIGGAAPALAAHLFADFLTRSDQIAAARELRDRFGARFFVASRWLRDEVLRRLPSAEVRVVPLPVNDVFFKEPLGAPSKRRGRWAYAGRIHPDKGLDQLLEHLLRAGARLPPLEILGWWSDDRYESWSASPEDFALRRRKLRSLIDVLQIEPRLMRTENTFADSLREVDALLFPSVFKGEEFGYALAQALAAGKCCWISDWRGHRDFADCPGVRLIRVQEETGEIPRLDFGGLAFPPEAASMDLRRRIRSWAQGNHSVEAVASSLKAALGRPIEARTS